VFWRFQAILGGFRQPITQGEQLCLVAMEQDQAARAKAMLASVLRAKVQADRLEQAGRAVAGPRAAQGAALALAAGAAAAAVVVPGIRPIR
jgi:hypothetical protein